MKKYIILSFLLLISIKAVSQENMVTLSSGYSFAKVEDTDAKVSGLRIGGLYEFNPGSGIIAHGFYFGYIGLKGTSTILSQEIKYTTNSFPLYYAPKVMFGGEKFKGFAKLVLGMQFVGMKREGATSFNESDIGIYTGFGGGVMYYIKENLFINAEYELAWASKSSYKDNWINTVAGGIGFKF